MNTQSFNNQNISPEWSKTMREIMALAQTLDHGEITIKVQDKKPLLTEYTIKRKTTDTSEFLVTSLT